MATKCEKLRDLYEKYMKAKSAMPTKNVFIGDEVVKQMDISEQLKKAQKDLDDFLLEAFGQQGIDTQKTAEKFLEECRKNGQ